MPWRVAGLAVRFVLLVTLLWGVFLTALSMTPAQGWLADFQRDLRAGRVEAIVVRDGYATPEDRDTLIASSLIWTTDSLVWRMAQDAWNAGYPIERFTTDLARASFDGRLIRKPRGGQSGFWPAWLGEVPHRYGQVVQAAWVMALVVMLFSRPRLANRWAWFWLFTVGQIGAPLFVLLESRPIWSALDPVPPRVVRPVEGGTGCGLAILLGFTSGLLMLAIGTYVADLTG